MMMTDVPIIETTREEARSVLAEFRAADRVNSTTLDEGFAAINRIVMRSLGLDRQLSSSTPVFVSQLEDETAALVDDGRLWQLP
jgi:hypothetical protein